MKLCKGTRAQFVLGFRVIINKINLKINLQAIEEIMKGNKWFIFLKVAEKQLPCFKSVGKLKAKWANLTDEDQIKNKMNEIKRKNRAKLGNKNEPNWAKLECVESVKRVKYQMCHSYKMVEKLNRWILFKSENSHK